MPPRSCGVGRLKHERRRRHELAEDHAEIQVRADLEDVREGNEQVAAAVALAAAKAAVARVPAAVPPWPRRWSCLRAAAMRGPRLRAQADHASTQPQPRSSKAAAASCREGRAVRRFIWGASRRREGRAAQAALTEGASARGKSDTGARGERAWRREGERAEAGGKARERAPIGGGTQDPRGSSSTLLESPQRRSSRFFVHRCEGRRRSFHKKLFLRTQCRQFKIRAQKVKEDLESSVPGVSVIINPQKPRRGCLEIREEGGEVFLSLLNMPRPFAPMKKLDMDKVIKDIAKKIS